MVALFCLSFTVCAMNGVDAAAAAPSSSHPRSALGAASVAVCILGCTGVVGQKFICLLTNHPYFHIVGLGASERSSGRQYSAAVSWRQPSAIPAQVAGMTVTDCDVASVKASAAQVVFSALDSSVAGEVESALAAAGLAVFSNARNHRYDRSVPILIPHVNAAHLELVRQQQRERGDGSSGGFIVTNSNCSSAGLVVALKPLQDRFGLEAVHVVTLQAISGAGYPGVSALDIVDNVIPFVSGEEDKLQQEPLKILGQLSPAADCVLPAAFRISAACNRVATLDGHMECVSVQLTRPASVQEVEDAMRSYESEAQRLQLPSAPVRPIAVLTGEDRPQPRLDRDAGGGMVVSVGRVRPCPLLSVKFVVCSHNTVIGAAGGSIQNAELAVAKGLIASKRC